MSAANEQSIGRDNRFNRYVSLAGRGGLGLVLATALGGSKPLAASEAPATAPKVLSTTPIYNQTTKQMNLYEGAFEILNEHGSQDVEIIPTMFEGREVQLIVATVQAPNRPEGNYWRVLQYVDAHNNLLKCEVIAGVTDRRYVAGKDEGDPLTLTIDKNQNYELSGMHVAGGGKLAAGGQTALDHERVTLSRYAETDEVYSYFMQLVATVTAVAVQDQKKTAESLKA